MKTKLNSNKKGFEVMRHLVICCTAVSLLTLFVPQREAAACSCLPFPPPAEAVAKADAVFLGKVLAFDEIAGQSRRLAHLEVIKIWKGRPNEADRVTTALNEAACGFDFVVGKTYLVYANKDENGGLYTHLCTRTQPENLAQSDLNYLRGFSEFPLALGNSWEFANSFGNNITETIFDTLRIKGNLYYRFDRFREFNQAFLRLSEDGKLFLRSDTLEQMWVDFNADDTTRWHVIGPERLAEWDVQLVSRTDTVVTKAGTFYPCLHFHFRFNGADYDWHEWYYSGIGTVRRDLYGIAPFSYPLERVTLNTPTSVEENPTGSTPRAFTLSQSYPNPFVLKASVSSRNTALIRYQLQEPAEVSLTIFNALGGAVRTLATGRKTAGEYSALWDGKDEAGRLAPSGVYFYRLQAGSFSELKKMVVIR
ncbi:T9SS type A sorting domain-containing protein [candidate division KSB1 bacterium]|nr:T9SS type A sorting domain-containing protein [candidate division KSB1 bacterium]